MKESNDTIKPPQISIFNTQKTIISEKKNKKEKNNRQEKKETQVERWVEWQRELDNGGRYRLDGNGQCRLNGARK
ncbi:hypothetical protein TorRG33x02_071370, partial [Trema orientale]